MVANSLGLPNDEELMGIVPDILHNSPNLGVFFDLGKYPRHILCPRLAS